MLSASPGAVSRVLGDPDHTDRDFLLQLILCPDESAQEVLEEDLAFTVMDEGQESRLIAYLQEARPRVVMTFPDGAQRVSVAAPDDAVELFVKTICLPAGLSGAISAHVPEDLQARVRVHLRNARLTWSAGRVAFLAIFLGTIAASDLLPCLDAVLRSMEESLPDADPAEYLHDRREWCRRMLRRAHQQEERAGRSNMETRVLAGQRGAYVDKRRFLHRLDCLNRILSAVGHSPSQ
ncbi:hypothetical protein ACFL0Q_03565, partial [Thermodesulfobacteriota bacterium]